MNFYYVHIRMNPACGEIEVVAEVAVPDLEDPRETALNSPWVVNGIKPKDMDGRVVKVEHAKNISAPVVIKWHNHPLRSL